VKKQPVAANPPALSVGLRRYLYFTAAVTGAVIMIVEILGAKMLAPYVGTSHFVWTAQIAVTLVALATGYYAGGRLVDRSAKLGRVYGCVLLAAIYLCLSVLIVKPVAFWCLENNKLAPGSLLASAFLFFVPLSLLAMVGPFFIRVLTSAVSGVGGNVGRLTAISTLGSFIGTLLIGYLLIPFFPNSRTMYGTAVVLMLVAGGYFFGWERKSANRSAVVAGMAACLLLGLAGVYLDNQSQLSQFIERFRGNSNFGMLQVVDDLDGSRRFYLNDFLTQNIYDPVEKKSAALFTYMLHDLARAYTRKIDSALCIGLGVGIVPRQFAREGVRVEVVEINPAVAPVARRYFDCELEQFRLYFDDGRHFVNRGTNRFDAIILDAFLGDSSPVHLMTKEAFRSMRNRLQPGGTLVINCFVDFSSGKDFFAASLDKTLKSVFHSVRIHSAGIGNVFFVASDQPELAIYNAPDLDQVHPDCRDLARYTVANVVEANPAHGVVLTDDYNPVEFFDAANREATRRRLVMNMRSL
jgi:predicted membrane-bound spermidine synthase